MLPRTHVRNAHPLGGFANRTGLSYQREQIYFARSKRNILAPENANSRAQPRSGFDLFFTGPPNVKGRIFAANPDPVPACAGSSANSMERVISEAGIALRCEEGLQKD
jgi:hypothetical protein